MRTLLAVLVAALALAAPAQAADFVFDEGIDAIARGPDGSLYVGGGFTREQRPTGAGIAVTQSGDGAPPLPFPQVAGTINAVVDDGHGGWYVGGDFDRIGETVIHNLAHLTVAGAVDTTWTPNPNGAVDTLLRPGTRMYVGGEFTVLGGLERSHLAAVDTVTGTVTAFDPKSESAIHSLALWDTTVYAGGAGVAALDAETGSLKAWAPDVHGAVNAIAVDGSEIYLGGSFGLAAFDPVTGQRTSWQPAVDGTVNALAYTGGTLYAGGQFFLGTGDQIDAAAFSVTTGEPTIWNPGLHDDLFGSAGVNALSVVGSTVYLGGQFHTVDGQPRSRLAAVTATTGALGPWNPQPNAAVNALAPGPGTIYAGGDFTGAGPPIAYIAAIARLHPDGSLDADWHPNPDGSVSSIVLDGTTLYLGGYFTLNGTHPGLVAASTATGALLDWSQALGDPVEGLAAADGKLFAASTVDGVSAFNLPAATPSGFGMYADVVFAVAATGTRAFVGGWFTSAGGAARFGLAAFDTGVGRLLPWDAGLSSGAFVLGLVVSGNTLYAYGGFDAAGGQLRPGLAALDVSSGAVQAFDPEVSGNVDALATNGKTVFVAGSVKPPGEELRHYLAALDPATGRAVSRWNPQVGGGQVWALLADGDKLYAAGSFTSVDGKVTGPFAVLDATPPAEDLESVPNPPVVKPAVVTPPPTAVVVKPKTKPKSKNLTIKFNGGYRIGRIPHAKGCRGVLTIQVFNGRKLLQSKTTKLDSRCRYKTTFSVARAKVGSAKRLSVLVRFHGNRYLGATRNRFSVHVPD